MDSTTTAQPFRVFWQPGCSSCVKVKEFLTSLGVPFESVNVMADPEGLKQMQAMGIRSVPVVTQGDRFSFAQSLSDVARFVGREVDLTPRLSAAQLVERWLLILEKARQYVERIPPERFATNAIPNRNRTVGAIAYHIYQIPDAFLRTVEDGLEDLRLVANTDPPASVTSIAQVLPYADTQRQAIADWWSRVQDKSCAWKVKMYYGEHSVHSFLERSAWHSAQHARQLASLIEGAGQTVPNPLTAADYKDLPLPNGLWE